MSSRSSKDLGYSQFGGIEYPPQFIQKLNTLKYQHAVVFCGQQLLHLIMRTLIHGDINNIRGCLRTALKSKTQYKNSFTKDELVLLEKGNHKRYDISLLFKIVQKICGLAPVGDIAWTEFTGGDGLEFLITTIKDMRNELVHNFEHVIDEYQLADNLIELTDLASKITSALRDRAQEMGTQLYVFQTGNQLSDIDFDSNETLQRVLRIIDDVKAKVNESVVPEGDDESGDDESGDEDEEDDDYESDSLQFDNTSQAAGAEGQVAEEPSLKEVFEDLTKKFWEYAGSKENTV